MKRFTLIALVAALLFGIASMASATELKVRGHLDVYTMWSANLRDFDSNVRDSDNHMTAQRMRTFFEFVANENLKAVLGLEIDNIWGESSGTDKGAQWGTDSKGNIKVKHAYLDFTLPDTAINVKAGLQYVALPSIFGHPVFDDDAAAFVVSAPINDMFALAVGYTRGYDWQDNDSLWPEGTQHSDNVDMAFLAAPVTMDGWSVAPYFAYARVGQDSNPFAGQSITSAPLRHLPWGVGLADAVNIWVLGAHAELSMFDPLTFAADLVYGEGRTKLDLFGLDTMKYKTRGWYGALAASYNFDVLTATLFGTYASGGSDKDDSDRFLPTLAEGWGLTPYIGGVRAFGTAHDSFATETLGVGSDGTGLWTLGLQLADMSFVENLSHELTIAFAQGTSKKNSGYNFTTKDNAWEVYLVNKYQIYENLAAINELGYFKPNLKDRAKYGKPGDNDASYFGTIGFAYSF